MPFVSVEFYGRAIEAGVDTGFNGALLIPRILAAEVQLDQLSDVTIETATGERTKVAAYEAEIEWLGSRRAVEVLAAEVDFVLLGMKLLQGARLEMEPAKGLLKISSS